MKSFIRAAAPWIVASIALAGCEQQLPTQVFTVSDPVGQNTRTEVVSVAQFAGVVFTFNHTRQLIEVENSNDTPVRIRVVRWDHTILLDKWIVFAGWDADHSARFSRGDLVTITVWHISLALDPLDEFSESVRL